jgi:hypothetical protein
VVDEVNANGTGCIMEVIFMKYQKLKKLIKVYEPVLLPWDILVLSMMMQEERVRTLEQNFMNLKNDFEKYNAEILREELEELEWKCYMESVGFDWKIYY